MGERVEKPLITLIHGRYFGGWAWKLVQKELSDLGWNSIAPTLDIENPNLSLEDHAHQVETEEAATGANKAIRVPHSWAGNIALRSSVEVPRKIGIINVASVFQNSSFPHISAIDFPKVTHSAAYDIIKEEPHKLWGMADIAFWHDATDPDLREWAKEQLRPHPRRVYEPPIKHPLRVPMTYIRTTMDFTVTKDCQSEMARLIGVNTTEDLESGHAPMLSQPQKLAQKIVELANQAIQTPLPSA